MAIHVDRFEYSAAFYELVLGLHKGMSDQPNFQDYIRTQLGGPDSRVVHITNSLCPEIEYHCGPLRNKKVLDFGCGTGASTAALALYSAKVFAFDIDKESLEVCKKRMIEHGLEDRVEFYSAQDIEQISDAVSSFDLVLANGVIEHIPLSRIGLRRRTVQAIFRLLKPSGYLYIHDTPNRLWPYDFHSTQLWFGPWTKPGSEWAYKRAIRRKRHFEGPRTSRYSLGLEEAGAWGATYWEIMGYLKNERHECINLSKGDNKAINFIGRTDKKKMLAEPLEILVGPPLAKLFHIPLVALAPNLNHLVVRRK